MCKSLSKNSFPTTGSLNALNLLSLEGLLAIVASLSSACHRDKRDSHDGDAFTADGGAGAPAGPGAVNAEQLRMQKVRAAAGRRRAGAGLGVGPGRAGGAARGCAGPMSAGRACARRGAGAVPRPGVWAGARGDCDLHPPYRARRSGRWQRAQANRPP